MNVKMKYNEEIKPADRVSEVKEYYFSRKLKEIAQLNAEGKDIISLGIGGPDRMPANEVINTLCDEAVKENNHSYQSYTGIPELRKAYADWYKKWYDVTLNPSNEILPLIGSKEGILHISLAFLNPGDGVLVPNPGYPTYTSISKLAQAKIYSYDLKEENGWRPDWNKLEKLPLENIKLMWMNYPHMPTGTPASKELFEQAIQFAKRHNIVIAHDNPYSFILNDTPLSILSIDGAKEIAIEMNSMSKSHNMAGWRMGMLATNPKFAEWILKVKSNIDNGQFKPAMLAAVKGLEAGKDWYDNVNNTYSKRRKIAEDIMQTIGCSFDTKQRGLFLWGKIPENELNSETLADRILYDANVFITPGFIFGSNGDRYIRISLCATESNMLRALDRIKNMINN